jgi:VanZ family protein
LNERSGRARGWATRARRALAGAALLAVAAFIALLDVRHGHVRLPYADRVPGEDFTGHLGLALLLSSALNAGLVGARIFGRRVGPRSITAAVALALALEELSQRFVRGRQVQLHDFAASMLGAALGGALVGGWLWWRARRRTTVRSVPTARTPGA